VPRTKPYSDSLDLEAVLLCAGLTMQQHRGQILALGWSNMLRLKKFCRSPV
jgi:hypothetical protein